MKEPKRLLSHGATDFERQLLRAVSSERPSALLRSRMQRSLGLVGPLAWASNVKAMFGTLGSKIAVSAAVAGVVVAGGLVGYQLIPSTESGEAARTPAPEPIDTAPAPVATAPASTAAAVPKPESVAAPSAAVRAPAVVADNSEEGRLREEIALLDGVKAALQRGERELARQSLDVYRERFPDGILRREANVLRRRAESKPGRASDGTSYQD